MGHDNLVLPTPSVAPTPAAKPTNWKLLISLIFGIILVLILAVCGFVYLIMSILKGSAVAREAIKRASENPAVISQLGTPLKTGWLVAGNISWTNDSRSADLAIPIYGPRNKGKIYVTAQKSEGAWSYSVLDVKIEGNNERIDLLLKRNISCLTSCGFFPLIPSSRLQVII